MSRMGIALTVILAGLLAYMLYLSFDDAAATGTEPDLVGALAAWVLIAAFTIVVYFIRKMVMRGTIHVFRRVNEFVDERERYED